MIEGFDVQWRDRVFAETFRNGRGEGAVEFSLSEQGFYGGADGHISPLFA